MNKQEIEKAIKVLSSFDRTEDADLRDAVEIAVPILEQQLTNGDRDLNPIRRYQMQREIKFRAWDKKQKSFINGFNMIGFSTGQGAPKKLQRFDTYWDEEEVVLMQYTGLKDKNGKTDIYEGDILQKPYGEDKTQYGIVKAETKTCNLHVEWNFKGKYEGKEYYDTNILPLRWIEDMIVIGNIYANPELLQKAGE